MIAHSSEGVLLPLFLYGLLILIYFIILKFLLDCIRQMTDKHHAQRSVIDVQIHDEPINTKVENSSLPFDPYEVAMTIVRIVLTFIGLLVLMIILIIKLNIIFAFAIIALALVVGWIIQNWQKLHRRNIVQRAVDLAIWACGGNIGMLVIFVGILLLLGMGILLLPHLES